MINCTTGEYFRCLFCEGCVVCFVDEKNKCEVNYQKDGVEHTNNIQDNLVKTNEGNKEAK
eukprot:CAMPEP_0170533984 /NCGR_PEP_ID=MMETSP0209-20121228/87141_1 /TAXON_ID=665100 ORGANISM="Litonotus pictus, Strain P1" /NCGR_SAMPLE_ID=MMETSP0209 /ASSEMBLY_ACC=CAM_ASM_000301 /LENGTH=59 /DNA_ID=CAMNT_0010832601 /DNA_START=178 /DNA_END=354 /DNA_ORIENTATION=+